MVRTINSMCLAAGPGPGGVSLTLRGKDLGAQGNWHPGGQGRQGFQLSPASPQISENICHLPHFILGVGASGEAGRIGCTGMLEVCPWPPPPYWVYFFPLDASLLA